MSKINCLEITSVKKGIAVPAFNIDNLESALAVCEVVKETKLPVIIQTIPRTLNYGGVETYPAMVNAIMSDCTTDYCMHLDHGNGGELALRCIKAGFSSVMYDGSSLPILENIIKTKFIVDLAKPFSVSVEGELGTIGGKEENDFESESSYTKVDEAIKFIAETGVDTLAIGVGTAHGIYKGIPKINVKRIGEISAATDTPLVLHGASGLNDDVVRACIDAGIKKINFATELRQAYTAGIKKGFEIYPKEFDPKIYMREAIDIIKQTVIKKLKICYNI